jgi:hypothetical protein
MQEELCGALVDAVRPVLLQVESLDVLADAVHVLRDEVLGELGTGGMAVVYRARDARRAAQLYEKALAADKASGGLAAAALRRLAAAGVREARLAVSRQRA